MATLAELAIEVPMSSGWRLLARFGLLVLSTTAVMLPACGAASASEPEAPRISCVDAWTTQYHWQLSEFWHNADVYDARRVLACMGLGAKDARGRTPLHLAVEYNAEPAVIAVLLEHGADIEARDDFGGTPLHAASRKANAAIVETLLDYGADIEAKDDLDNTPLETAAGRGEPAVMTILLDRGALVGDLYWTEPVLRQLIDARETAARPEATPASSGT